MFDLPEGGLIDADTPAPVRFLPEYDNVLLSHADRRRIFPEAHPSLYEGARLGIGHVLVDGTLQATWRLDRPKGAPAAIVTWLPQPRHPRGTLHPRRDRHQHVV